MKLRILITTGYMNLVKYGGQLIGLKKTWRSTRLTSLDWSLDFFLRHLSWRFDGLLLGYCFGWFFFYWLCLFGLLCLWVGLWLCCFFLCSGFLGLVLDGEYSADSLGHIPERHSYHFSVLGNLADLLEAVDLLSFLLNDRRLLAIELSF